MRSRLFWRHLPNLAETGYWFDHALIPELEAFAAERREGVVLDFGCGTKPFEGVFRHRGFRYVGLDVYPGARVDVVYDGRAIPLRSESVDLVFASSVLEHVEDLGGTLRELQRVLRPGGRLAAVVPFMGHVHGSPFDYHRPTRYGWEAIARAAFGADAEIRVRPVDGRLNALANLTTSQLNLAVLDLLRAVRRLQPAPRRRPSLEEGGASPESRGGAGMRLAYRLARLNPINFVIGLLSWSLAQVPWPTRRTEGEITSGYLIAVRK